MNSRRFLTPAYLTSLALVLLGAVCATAGAGVFGWILLLMGLGLNLAASMVTSNREELRASRRPGPDGLDGHRE